MSDFDIVIRGGIIVDGSGGEPFQGDVAVAGGKIVEISEKIPGRGAQEIDAAGKVVTPGFVDVHTHYDGQITWENRLSPSSDHGVTTVVMGNCGVGFAPIRSHQRDLAVKLMEGVEDIPEVVMTTGVPFNWETFPEYLDVLETRESDIDFATQLPHSPLRVYVMGERGVNHEPPTEQDLAEMRRLTAEAVRAGALGVATSRVNAHRFRDGKLAPSVPTEEREVLALAGGLRDAGTGVFQMVPNYDISAEERYNLLHSIAETSGRPVSFTFMASGGNKEKGDWPRMLEYLEQSEQEGLTIRGQVLPRPTGGLLGLELSLHPFSLNPSYREIESLPLAQKVERMRDPEFRRRLLSESPEDPHDFFKFIISDHEALFILGDPPNYHPAPEESIAARARARGIDPKELIYDALLERDGHEILYRPLGNSEGDKFETVGRHLLDTDKTIIALGDGGAHYSTICDAAYTTYTLLYWCRDATADRKLELSRLIKKLTSEPAAAVELYDRGLLKAGYKADINVIDFDKLHLYAPHPVYDLPAGGRRLCQKADGYEATIVSGKITYRNGVATGTLPGRLVRGAQTAPVGAEQPAA